jgi:polyisoprenoid-binding protein YceI
MKVLLCLLACLALPAWAQDWRMDPASSRLGFAIRQMNVPTEGGFKRFVARANFDPARPEGGRLQVEVDLESIDTGSPEGDVEVRRPIWFDTARHPKASFVSRSVRREADGRYTALGDLTLKGQRRPLAAPFTLQRQAGGGFVAEGRFPLKRSDFAIGAGEWNDVVADEAEIRFRILLLPTRRAP